MTYPEKNTSGSVLHWREGAVAHIRFNRPASLNAINREMAAGFHRACKNIAADAAVRAVLVSGEGRAFMAGGDLDEMLADPAQAASELIAGMHGGIRLLTSMNAPVVCAVQGAVAGGGLGLMLACDLAIAAEGTRFSVAYPLIGASCDCSTSWGLPRVLGLRRAMQLALLGDTVDAQEALSLGLVNRVVPVASMDAEVEALLQRLANGPTQALGRMKKLLRKSSEHGIDAHLDAEAEGFVACSGTADFREGISAFREKRAARFQGI
ncbi:enoyl-CoA hydratase [Diaphorobacter sp. HDW4A]|uniref:enoyl-CoA hydratase/isomerase family protein n=1 Tax=Diaphorobacter sp. HDW4A TaxID=2714924 RepID=UPI00140E0D01|nr:enoyl-CoA hydratase-related protein [Diaphorobacter sp. HDW4A]QIL79539.1 enoyl-CoA hydratase [Diaphorobacter sp. HDW4A]